MMETNAYSAHQFMESIAVVCPKCGQQATVVGGDVGEPDADFEKDVRFFCDACGYAVRYGNTPKFTAFVDRKGKIVRGRKLLLGAACDPFFGFRLWYVIEVAQGTLWAYNLAHLGAIERGIAEGQGGADLLPQWATDTEYRVLLLKLIQAYL